MKRKKNHKELIEKNNRLKESFNSIKRETNLGNEIQIHVKKSILKLQRIIKENIDNFKKIYEHKKDIIKVKLFYL